MTTPRKASILFILVTLAIDAIGLGIIIPVLPDVIRRFISDESSVAQIYGYFIAVYALLQFISSPLLGRLSDRFGRRPVLLISLLGASIDYVFMAFAPHLILLFIGRIISGVSGASYTVASAYIADVSDDSNRSKNFGIMGAGFGIGFILGPAIGGVLANYGAIYPFLAAAAFNLLNFLFGFFILPESLPPERRRAFDRKLLNPFRSLSGLTKVPAVRLLVLSFILIQFAGQTHPSIWTLYTQHRFGWSAAEVGMSLALVGILSALSQGVLTGPIVKRFGERHVMFYGVFFQAIGFALYGLATTGPMVYFVLIASSFFWAAHPAMQSLISRETPPEEQGELQGGLMSMASLTAVINPLVMTAVFAETSKVESPYYLPGAPYFLAGFMFFLGWLAVMQWGRTSSRKTA